MTLFMYVKFYYLKAKPNKLACFKIKICPSRYSLAYYAMPLSMGVEFSIELAPELQLQRELPCEEIQSWGSYSQHFIFFVTYVSV